MTSSFYYPSPVLLERGGFSRFISNCPVPYKRLLVITGHSSMKALGILDEIRDIARRGGVECFFYSGVNTNPTDCDADTICAFREECNADAVMGIGGGSCVDLAKIVAMQATNGGAAWDYINLTGRPGKKITMTTLPIIAIPTTAGTGSEATPYAVITNAETRMKKGIGSPKLYPSLVILDPSLLCSLPRRLTAISGFDAFGQALESYTSGRSTFHSREFSFLSLQHIIGNFQRSYEEPDDVDCRSRMAWGAFLSGLAIGITDVNLAHALSHPLSAHYGLEHGLAVLLCTIQAIQFNRSVVSDRYLEVARLFHIENGSEEARIDALVETIKRLTEACGLSLALKDYTVPESKLERLAEDAMEIGAIRTNPRPITKDQLLLLYQKVWRGEIG